jgi:SAM-dependent methyltransferase
MVMCENKRETISVKYPNVTILDNGEIVIEKLQDELCEIFESLNTLKTKQEWANLPKLTSLDELLWCQEGSVPHSYRNEYVKLCGFAVHTQEVVDTLAGHFQNKKVIDVGCGNGYLTRLLSERNVDIVGVDNYIRKYSFGTRKLTSEIRRRNGVFYVKNHGRKFDAMILSWPCYNTDFAHRVASFIRKGQLLYYLGEGDGGCTGDADFHEYVQSESWLYEQELSEQLNNDHIQFSGIHDSWHVYRKIVD